MDNWIIYSALMFGFSVIMYLLTRKLQTQNIDNKLVTYAMGALPMPILLLYLLTTNTSFAISLPLLGLVGICAILFSYLGFRFSLQATKDAPNPGYSLIIQKSYAPYTALMGIFLFNQKISITGGIAILIIIASTSLILINRNSDKQQSDKKWIAESFIAFFLFGTLSLTSKFVLGNGVTPLLLTFYNFLFNTFAFSIDYRKALRISNLRLLTGDSIITLIIIAVATAIFNIMMFSAIKLAPNIGYVNIINSSSITVITILSAILYKDKLSIKKVLGILGVTFGLILLFI
jgi:drug/metabolite transporter (DMT)-like permease